MLKSEFQLAWLGFERKTTKFEAAPKLTLAALRQEMLSALRPDGGEPIDFKVLVDKKELDQNTSFDEIKKDSLLLLDPVIEVHIKSRQGEIDNRLETTMKCYASTTIGALRNELPDSVGFVPTRPRLLKDSMTIANIAVISEATPATPICLWAETKHGMFIGKS